MHTMLVCTKMHNEWMLLYGCECVCTIVPECVLDLHLPVSYCHIYIPSFDSIMMEVWSTWHRIVRVSHIDECVFSVTIVGQAAIQNQSWVLAQAARILWRTSVRAIVMDLILKAGSHWNHQVLLLEQLEQGWKCSHPGVTKMWLVVAGGVCRQPIHTFCG